jgi:hypothetical protein
MKVRCVYGIGLIMILAFVFSLRAQGKVYWDVVEKIMEEAFEHSQVMENASWLTNVSRPRNAKSSSQRAAAEWAKKRLEEYGLSNAKSDPYYGISYSEHCLAGCVYSRRPSIQVHPRIIRFRILIAMSPLRIMA